MGRKTTNAMRDVRLNQITGWLNRGWTQPQIIKETGLSKSQIFNDVQEIKRRWRFEARDYQWDKAQMIASLDEQIVELWEAWEKSKLPASKKIQERHEGVIRGRRTDGDVRHEEKEERYGDPSIMAQITRLQEMKIKLLGLNEPAKIALTDTQGRSIFPELPDDDLYTAITILKQAGLPAPSTPTNPQGDSSERNQSDIIDAEPL